VKSKGELLADELNAYGATPYWPEGSYRGGNWDVELLEHPEGADRGGFVPTYTDLHGSFSDWVLEEHWNDPNYEARPHVDTTGGTAYFCVHNEQWLAY
jgi:hypothetical protein